MSSEKIARWLAEPPPDDVRQAIDRLSRGDDVRHVAVMPDVHLSRDVCVGVALATENTLVPAAVGGDIGCGMAALAFDAPASLLDAASAAASVLDALYRSVPIMRHHRAARVALTAGLDRQPLSSAELQAKKGREAALQFGTLGRGNHFLEFQSDDEGRLWLMVHSGSRGMGQAIREAHERGGTKDRAGLLGIPADSDAGRQYIADVGWALEYAARSRERMLDQVRQIMLACFKVEADERSLISCHHNFVRREVHGDARLWVHRKGAISARRGEPGIIPGSMGSPSFHVEGRGCEKALCSSSHGAGRAMSRSVARRRITRKQLEDSMSGVWFDHRMSRRLVEEAPAAYKDIGAVMRAQRELTKIRRRLRPVLSFKGG